MYMLTESIGTIIFMVVVGSLIAGSTNHLAIQMLFRPYEAKYIGKWQVPFTPGLISKRRDELAVQLGNMVEEYLMTPEMIRKKVITEETELKINEMISNYVKDNFLVNELSLKDYLHKFNQYDKISYLENKIDIIIEEKIIEMKNILERKRIADLLGENGLSVINKRVPEISSYILIKGIEYVGSEEGDNLIKGMVEEFLTSKGKLGGMVKLLVGDSKLVKEKIKKELINVLKSEKAFNTINSLLLNEVAKITEKEVVEIIGEFDVKPLIELAQTNIKETIKIDSHLDKKLSDYIPNLENLIKEKIVPTVVTKAFVLLDSKIELLLEKVDLKGLVKEQVDTFPVRKLEELLLGVTKKEFKMITLLGFVLGAIIGLFQGIIAVMF